MPPARPISSLALPLAVASHRGFWSEVRGSLRGEELDYTTHPLTRAIWLLAIPMVLEMVMESTFAIVDVFFVVRLGDRADRAAHRREEGEETRGLGVRCRGHR